MLSSSSSPMVGRADQLAVLRRLALDAADRRPGLAVIEGEAGIGKSRLVAELATELAAGGALILRGNCSPVAGRDIAFGPFVDALRDLLREVGADVLCDSAGAGPTTLARLLPELGSAGGDPGFELAGGASEGYTAVAEVVRRVAATRPVLVVIEDVHWADRSSLDLLTYLARTLRDERLAILLTVRAPDPAYDDVRACVADLARLPLAVSVTLRRLDDHEAADQVRNLDGGSSLDDRRVARIVELSEGVPLLVEELVNAPTLEADEVAERLLGHRVASLPPAGRAVVEAAALAVAAPTVTDLATVSLTSDEAAFDEGLAIAVSSGVLGRHRQTVDFHHALFREAVLARLAPHTARRLHAAWAELVERQTPSLAQAITLAHHRTESGDATRALVACLAAEELGDPLGAFPEVYRILLKAIELWPQVPDAESRTGVDLATVLADAAEVAIIGAAPIEEARDLLRRARAALAADASPARRAWLDLVGHWGSVRHDDDEPALTDSELLAVVETIPREPPRFRWWACQDAADVLLDAGRMHEAETYVRELLEMAAGEDGAMANAMRYESKLERDRGHRAEAVEIARDAVRRADRSGIFLYRSRCLATYAGRLYDVGDLPGAAKAAEQTVIVLGGDRPGPVPLEWATNACNLSELLLDLGRWQDAHRQAAAVLDADNVPELAHIWARRVQMVLCARQGTVFTQAPRPADDGRLSGKGRAYVMFDELVEAELRRAAGDLEGARTALIPALDLEPPIRNTSMAMRVLAMGADIEADRASEAGSPASEEADWVAERIRLLLDALPVGSLLDEAFATTARAHLSRHDGEDDPEVWAGVVERWRWTAMPYELGWALLRLGACAAREGKSDQARDAFEETVRIGTDLGAWPLVDAAEATARRLRVRLSTVRRGSPAAFGLTTRELEVLRLLADGATNGAIAQKLFMSPKTASVHVSHVIAKLGVANRTEAAAQAHRSGLVASPGPGEP